MANGSDLRTRAESAALFNGNPQASAVNVSPDACGLPLNDRNDFGKLIRRVPKRETATKQGEAMMNPEQDPQSGESDESPTFEASVSELQEIVGQLEDGSLALEESMRQFERGVALLRNCYQVLEQAEQRIEILTSPDSDGNPQTNPFDASSTMDRQAEQKQSPAPPGGAPRRSPRDDASSLF